MKKKVLKIFGITLLVSSALISLASCDDASGHIAINSSCDLEESISQTTPSTSVTPSISSSNKEDIASSTVINNFVFNSSYINNLKNDLLSDDLSFTIKNIKLEKYNIDGEGSFYCHIVNNDLEGVVEINNSFDSQNALTLYGVIKGGNLYLKTTGKVPSIDDTNNVIYVDSNYYSILSVDDILKDNGLDVTTDEIVQYYNRTYTYLKTKTFTDDDMKYFNYILCDDNTVNISINLDEVDKKIQSYYDMYDKKTLKQVYESFYGPNSFMSLMFTIPTLNLTPFYTYLVGIEAAGYDIPTFINSLETYVNEINNEKLTTYYSRLKALVSDESYKTTSTGQALIELLDLRNDNGEYISIAEFSTMEIKYLNDHQNYIMKDLIDEIVGDNSISTYALKLYSSYKKLLAFQKKYPLEINATKDAKFNNIHMSYNNNNDLVKLEGKHGKINYTIDPVFSVLEKDELSSLIKSKLDNYTIDNNTLTLVTNTSKTITDQGKFQYVVIEQTTVLNLNGIIYDVSKINDGYNISAKLTGYVKTETIVYTFETLDDLNQALDTSNLGDGDITTSFDIKEYTINDIKYNSNNNTFSF